MWTIRDIEEKIKCLSRDINILYTNFAILNNSTHIRVATYAAMEDLLKIDQPREFTVENDEIQGIEEVPYLWDGKKLFVYNTLVEPQPEL